jgi:hypothetical protein
MGPGGYRSSNALIAIVVGTGFVFACGACGSSKASPFDDADAGGERPEAGVLDAAGGGAVETGTPCAPSLGNYDVPGNGCDDDADGTVDNAPTCDSTLSASGSAEDFAKALGICATADKNGYGLVSAQFTRGAGAGAGAPVADQHGILPKFGDVIRPREGAKIGVLSTGYAQEFNGSPNRRFGGENLAGEESSKDWMATGALPSGFPKPATGCDQASEVHDVIALELKLRAPKNASGFHFDLNFFSSEWPAYVCSKFNDGFIAYLSAKGFNKGTPDNIAFDAKQNAISVNSGFFDRCTPNVDTGCAPGATPATSTCPAGAKELSGTGFGVVGKWCEVYAMIGAGGNDTSTNGGATGWLTSSAPIAAGEQLTLALIIWDTGDGILDSSVLLDKFEWTGNVAVGTARP